MHRQRDLLTAAFASGRSPPGTGSATGGAGAARRAGDSRHDVPGREGGRAGRRQWDVKGDTTLGPFGQPPSSRVDHLPTLRAPGCRPPPSPTRAPARRKVILTRRRTRSAR
jgi:hypothetical protein